MTEGKFYEKATNEAGKEIARIADPDAAHELAIIEATMGREKALAREQELKRQHETGLTDKERNIVAFNEGLVAKYPHTFSIEIGSNGKVYYEVKPVLYDIGWVEDHTLQRVILTQDGILEVRPEDQGKIERQRFTERMKDVGAAELTKLVQDGAKVAGEPLGRRETRVHLITGRDNSYNPYKVRLLDPFSEIESQQGLKLRFEKVEDCYSQIEQKTIKAVPSVGEALANF